jgi:hypothetical protein
MVDATFHAFARNAPQWLRSVNLQLIPAGTDQLGLPHDGEQQELPGDHGRAASGVIVDRFQKARQLLR